MDTVDDQNPLISYQPREAWIQHNITTDAIAANFYGQTFTQTRQQNATLSFNFDGHSVTILGSTNGSFVATIDGEVHPGSGTKISQSAQVASLFAINTLDLGNHNITITNLDETATLYVDSITWTASPANKTGTLNRTVIDDVLPTFHFEEGVWSTSSLLSKNFVKDTGHTTMIKGASVDLTFTSIDSLSLLGSVGPDHGRYSVQLDDQTPQMFQAAQLTPAVQVWIYYISHLVPGEHTLHVVNEDNAVFAIDAVIFSTIVNVTTSATPLHVSTLPPSSVTVLSNPSSIPNAAGSSRPSAGAIGGAVIGSIIALLLIILGLLFCLRKRLSKGRESVISSHNMSQAPLSSPNWDNSTPSQSRDYAYENSPLYSAIESPGNKMRRFYPYQASTGDYPSSESLDTQNIASTSIRADDGLVDQTKDRRSVRKIQRDRKSAPVYASPRETTPANRTSYVNGHTSSGGVQRTEANDPPFSGDEGRNSVLFNTINAPPTTRAVTPAPAYEAAVVSLAENSIHAGVDENH